MPDPGDLITRDGQAEIRGLLIGSGTPYAVDDWTGLGLPEVREADAEREADDGDTGGLDTYAKRSVSATIGISAWDRLELVTHRDALAAAFARTAGPRETVPFVIRQGGPARRIHGRPRRLDLPWSGMASHGMMIGGAFMVEALDPYAYALTVSTETIEIPDAGTTASKVVNNTGNGRTLPTLTITGPATDPVVANLATGIEARFEIVLGSTDVLVVDPEAGTMHLNGARVWVGAAGYEPITLAPGSQEISYTRTGTGVPSTLELAWRDAWLSI